MDRRKNKDIKFKYQFDNGKWSNCFEIDWKQLESFIKGCKKKKMPYEYIMRNRLFKG